VQNNGTILVYVEQNLNQKPEMVYTSESYPAAMRDLSEDVRDRAIRITNSLIIDGDVRVHEDIIIAYAIHEAKLWHGERTKNQPD
jgi:uncharacterized protein YdaT